MTLLTVLAASAASAETENFEDARAGEAPPGWECGVTGKGTPRWAVEAEGAKKLLRQSGSGTFPWCVKKSVSVADGFVEVRFKPEQGREDQAGGVVWRWKDGDNYYVARGNALENNVSLYHTTKGKRNTIRYVDAPVAGNVWHTLRVEFSGNRIKVLLDGKQYIEAQDTHIQGAGALGVWTKADSVTAFSEFSYGAVK
jgi:hypothetical protein